MPKRNLQFLQATTSTWTTFPFQDDWASITWALMLRRDKNLSILSGRLMRREIKLSWDFCLASRAFNGQIKWKSLREYRQSSNDWCKVNGRVLRSRSRNFLTLDWRLEVRLGNKWCGCDERSGEVASMISFRFLTSFDRCNEFLRL